VSLKLAFVGIPWEEQDSGNFEALERFQGHDLVGMVVLI